MTGSELRDEIYRGAALLERRRSGPFHDTRTCASWCARVRVAWNTCSLHDPPYFMVMALCPARHARHYNTSSQPHWALLTHIRASHHPGTVRLRGTSSYKRGFTARRRIEQPKSPTETGEVAWAAAFRACHLRRRFANFQCYRSALQLARRNSRLSFASCVDTPFIQCTPRARMGEF
jgi:hypothetical protein